MKHHYKVTFSPSDSNKLYTHHTVAEDRQAVLDELEGLYPACDIHGIEAGPSVPRVILSYENGVLTDAVSDQPVDITMIDYGKRDVEVALENEMDQFIPRDLERIRDVENAGVYHRPEVTMDVKQVNDVHSYLKDTDRQAVFKEHILAALNN